MLYPKKVRSAFAYSFVAHSVAIVPLVDSAVLKHLTRTPGDSKSLVSDDLVNKTKVEIHHLTVS